jgi:uncharacterized protein YjcR
MPRRLYSLLYDLSELRAMYWQGWPTARIARHLRLDPQTVRRILVKNGLPAHTRLSANQFTAQEHTPAQRRAQTAAARAQKNEQAASRLAGKLREVS